MWPFSRDHDYVIRDGGEAIDQRGRLVRFLDGKVYALDAKEPRLLYDANPNHFTPIVAPDWATEW